MNIGFIGLGRMGTPMALHRIHAGHQAFVQTRGGLQGNTGPRNTLVHRRSISPMATKAFALKINTLGADDINAPVSGGAVGAKAAVYTQVTMSLKSEQLQPVPVAETKLKPLGRKSVTVIGAFVVPVPMLVTVRK